MKFYLVAAISILPSLCTSFQIDNASRLSRSSNKQAIVPLATLPSTASVTSPSSRGNLVLAMTESNANSIEITDMVAEANRIFDSIDKDSNGEICNDELRVHLEKNGYSAESIRNLFTALDKNADGAISREEMEFAFANYETTALYMAFGVSGEQVSAESYDDAVGFIRSSARTDNDKYVDELLFKLADLIFDMIDTDQSGEIDASELQEHFQQGAGKSTVRETGNASLVSAKAIFKALDLNSDGRISREEMRAGFKQYDALVLSKALGLKVTRTSEV